MVVSLSPSCVLCSRWEPSGLWRASCPQSERLVASHSWAHAIYEVFMNSAVLARPCLPPTPRKQLAIKRKAALTATKTAQCFLGELPAKIRTIACRIYTAAVRSLPVPVTSSWENQWRNLQRREVHCGSQLAPRPVGPFQLVGSGTWLMGPAVAKAHGTAEPFTSCPRRKTKVGRDNSPLSGYTSEDLWMSSQSPQHKKSHYHHF